MNFRTEPQGEEELRDKSAYYSGARRQLHSEIGTAGEERVRAILAEIYGQGALSWGVPIQSAGTNFLPDLTLRTSKGAYALEVKTMLPFLTQAMKAGRSKTYERVGSVKLNRVSWQGICKWARRRDMVPMLVAEVRIGGSKYGHLYFFLEGTRVDEVVQATEAEWIHFTLYDLAALSIWTFRPGRPRVLGDVL